MSFLSIAQKSEIRRRAATESSTALSAEFGITRARIRQIATENTAKWRDYKSRTNSDQRNQWATDLNERQRQIILDSPDCHAVVARRLGIPKYRVQRLRHSLGMLWGPGRPRANA